MGVNYSTYIVFGIAISDLVEEYSEVKEQTKYNENTGKPYTTTYQDSWMTVQVGTEEKRFTEWYEIEEFFEYESPLDVYHDGNYGGANPEGSVVGEYESLGMEEGVAFDHEEVRERILEVTQTLKDFGLTFNSVDVKMWVFARSS